MRILVLGGTGMLGHRVHLALAQYHDVLSTSRKPVSELPVNAEIFFRQGRVVDHFDVLDLSLVEQLMTEFRPDAVVNCVGIVKQRASAHDPISSISVNALLPHQLANLCAGFGARLLQFSTDCVFSGDRGDYKEDSPSDAQDLYGRTKYLGEVAAENVLTIRTSIIGRELDHFQSLVEWLLRQEGPIRGYTRAIYTGLTTIQMAKLISSILTDHPGLEGLYQVASAKITKYDLLTQLQDAFELQARISIDPFDGFECDRSLSGDRFEGVTGFAAPPWPEMIDELALDSHRYGGVHT